MRKSKDWMLSDKAWLPSTGFTEQAAGGGEGVNVGEGFVGADAHDAGEAHGQPALVTRAALDAIEGNFQDCVRFAFVGAAGFAKDAREEGLGQLRDFGGGQSTVSLADGFQL